MKSTNRDSTITTAYHEAGHAVAALVLGLPVGRQGISIVPNRHKNYLGMAHVLKQLHVNPKYATSARMRARVEDFAIMCMAGGAAQQKFKPHSHLGMQQDVLSASALLDYVSDSPEESQVRLKVAHIAARNLVQVQWASIESIATALYESKTLNAEQVRAAFVLTRGS